MVGSRWARRIAPGLAALGAVTVIASTTLGARDRPWEPPPCTGSNVAPAPTSGTWWRLDPRLVDGALIGQRLALGGPGVARPRFVDLDVESFAAGPFDGQVLVGMDDGKRSTLSLLDPARGCTRIVAESSDVIRRATLAADGSAVVEFRLDRSTRTELGIFHRPLTGAGPVTRILDPIEPDVRFGPTWTTELAWSTEGRRLAVQSCGAIACRTRVVDLADGSVRAIADPSHGDLVGFADGRLVLHEACGGLPCALVSVDVETDSRVTLDPEAWQAVVVADPGGRPVVIHETGPGGATLRSVGVAGHDAHDLPADPLGRRLVAGPARAGVAAEVGPGVVLLGPDGRLPLDGPLPPILRRLADGASISLDEVSR